MRILLLIFFSLNLFASERVIALSPSINEIIFALGKGHSVVGNTKFCTYPQRAQSITKVGGYFNVSIEKVLTLKPDMVMMQSYDKKLIKELKKLHIKTMVLEFNSLESLKRSIQRIADYYDEKIMVNEILTKINKSLKSTENIIENKKIMIVISATTNLNKQIFIIGHNMYLEDIILYSGNRNAYNYVGNQQPLINLEQVIALNPDIVILLAPYLRDKKFSKEELIKRWKEVPITASKKNRIYIVDKEYAGIPSPRVEYFINDFKEILQDAKSK